MTNEKFIVLTKENQLQINIRNMLCPAGYFFLVTCSDSPNLLRSVRSYNPDFIIVDVNAVDNETIDILRTIDEELLCNIILLGDTARYDINDLVETTNTVYSCLYSIEKHVLISVIEISAINIRRVRVLNNKIRELTENFETRKLVEKAKYALMEKNGISEKEAYERIRKKSMNTRLPMKQIANAILNTYDIE